MCSVREWGLRNRPANLDVRTTVTGAGAGARPVGEVDVFARRGAQATAQVQVFTRRASGLVRVMSPYSAFAYNVLNIGVIFPWVYITTIAFQNGASVWAGILLCGLFTSFLAVAYTGLASAMPRTGGGSVLQSRTFRGGRRIRRLRGDHDERRKQRLHFGPYAVHRRHNPRDPGRLDEPGMGWVRPGASGRDPGRAEPEEPDVHQLRWRRRQHDHDGDPGPGHRPDRGPDLAGGRGVPQLPARPSPASDPTLV